jgi:hypothetical protein
VIDLAAMTAPEWVSTAGLVGSDQPLDFGLVPLQPADFADHAPTLFGLVAAADQPEAAEREVTRADRENVAILACLSVRYVRAPGGERSPMRLVLNEADHDPAAGRLHFGWVPEFDLGAIAGHAIARYAEAALRARRFRVGSEADPHDRRNGAEIQHDPGAVAHADGR